MASFLELNLENAQELKTIPAGEARLRCVKADIVTKEETGNKYVKAIFDIVDRPDTQSVIDILMLPDNSQDAKSNNRRLFALKSFCAAMGLPLVNPELTAAVGRECWAVLTEGEDPQYGKSNRVKSYVKSA